MKVGYIHTDGQPQSREVQEAALKPYDVEKMFEDKDRRSGGPVRLQALLEFVRAGDIVHVESLGRLAHSALDILEIMAQLSGRKVGFVAVKENIDTATEQGLYAMALFDALSQVERDAVAARRREGLEAARAKGKRLGRPRIVVGDDFANIYKQWKAGKISAVQAMKLSGLKKNTFYSRVKELETAGVFKKFNWGIRIN